ncbi:hypothetical protein TorRG33x02_148000 [Trema orientale]|uniref:Uncharacterized protein n=1 Tax=Trema orientale TaxID=63057 RepID=A0A2P5EV75_TREOI|nr:hypothetical protein TorRG33x02_148000 [Trema orientale]
MKKSMNNSLNKLVFSLLLIIFLACLGGPLMLLSAQNTSTVTVDVGVVVDYRSRIGKMGLSCINTALSDLYASYNANYNTKLVLHIRDSKSDVVGAAAAGT